jgi:Tfp pilus assembly protein PilF
LLEDAVKEFDRALFIEGSYVTARNNLGVALLEQGKVDAAAAHFRSVLEMQPRNLDAMINLALAEKAAGRLERGKESLLRALGIDPRSAVAHYNLATLYDQTGEVSSAVVHYRAFLDNAGAEHAARAPGVRARVDALTKPRQP